MLLKSAFGFLRMDSLVIPSLVHWIPKILFPSIYLAVPKKKRSKLKKKMQNRPKFIRPLRNITECPICSKPKLMHNLCANCLKRYFIEKKRAIGVKVMEPKTTYPRKKVPSPYSIKLKPKRDNPKMQNLAYRYQLWKGKPKLSNNRTRKHARMVQRAMEGQERKLVQMKSPRLNVAPNELVLKPRKVHKYKLSDEDRARINALRKLESRAKAKARAKCTKKGQANGKAMAKARLNLRSKSKAYLKK